MVDRQGNVVPVPAFDPPAAVGLAPFVAPPAAQGPTYVGEWLMVDVRIAKKIAPDSRLYRVCQDLSERGACGVVESTLVIDVLEATSDDRRFILAESNWPR